MWNSFTYDRSSVVFLKWNTKLLCILYIGLISANLFGTNKKLTSVLPFIFNKLSTKTVLCKEFKIRPRNYYILPNFFFLWVGQLLLQNFNNGLILLILVHSFSQYFGYSLVIAHKGSFKLYVKFFGWFQTPPRPCYILWQCSVPPSSRCDVIL